MSKSAWLQLEQKAGLGLDEVRILITLGDGFDADLVSADLLGQGRHVCGRRDDVEFLSGGSDGKSESREHQAAYGHEVKGKVRPRMFISPGTFFKHILSVLERMRSVGAQREHDLQ